MIVWLASYPRSGNTFLRLVLHRLFNVSTYSVYENDWVAQRVGAELVGYRLLPADRTEMRDSAEIYFTKTHKRRKADDYPAVYLVRDGRDTVVSHARLRATNLGAEMRDDPAIFEILLREEITRPYIDGQPSSGTWGGNVLSWLGAAGAPIAVLKYEDLIANPLESVQRVVLSLLPELVPVAEVSIPSFRYLHGIDPLFFRRGTAGAYRTEMSPELHELFWAQPENATAMGQLGYLR
jgi:hypothetical protein